MYPVLGNNNVGVTISAFLPHILGFLILNISLLYIIICQNIEVLFYE